MPNHEPRISVNKLAEYVTSKAQRQRQILRDQKFPKDYKKIYHKEASEAISLFIAGGMLDHGILERKMMSLGQQEPDNVNAARRLGANISAIETFLTMLDDVDLGGASPELGQRSPPKLKIRNVAVSMRPEIILRGTNRRRQQTVGVVKLHFSMTLPLDADMGGYVSAVGQEFCRTHMHEDGLPDPTLSFVIDVASRTVHPGVKSVRQRMNEIGAACEQIADLWPRVTEQS